MSAARDVGLPCVIKPTSLAASQGVIRVDLQADVAATAERVRGIVGRARGGNNHDLLVEQYVDGREVALEGLVRGGRLDVLALFDKPDPLQGPYFEETIYVTPARLEPADNARVVAAIERAVAALGLREGPIHAEARLGDSGVWVLEVAARSIGGLCSRALRFGAGVSLEEIILRHALGLGLDDLRLAGRAAGVMMLPINRRGILRAVNGRKSAEAVPGISGVTVSAPLGSEVVPLPDGDRYLGFLFAASDTPDGVERALRRAYGCLDVVIEPEVAGPSREPDRSRSRTTRARPVVPSRPAHRGRGPR